MVSDELRGHPATEVTCENGIRASRNSRWRHFHRRQSRSVVKRYLTPKSASTTDFKDREDRKQFSVLSDERKRAITRAAIADMVANGELTENLQPGTPKGERTFVRTGGNPWD